MQRQRKIHLLLLDHATLEATDLTTWKYKQTEGTMNTFIENHSYSPIEEKQEESYITTVGRERIRVVNIFIGSKSASKAIYDAAIKKILYDTKDNL